jgi:hypothetical protein
MLLIAIVSFMASCSDQASSGNRDVTQLVRVRLVNGEVDWIRLNSVEMKVFLTGDTININRLTHRIQADRMSQKAVIISKIN